jgi:hypothetical protein
MADDEAIERSTEEALPESADEAETLIIEDLVDKAEETEDPDVRRSAKRVKAELDKMAAYLHRQRPAPCSTGPDPGDLLAGAGNRAEPAPQSPPLPPKI